jgi:DNA repair exonuclease SbcCD ATPase subunit
MSEPIRKEQIAEEGLFDNVIKPMIVAREEFDKLNVVIKSTAENLGKLNASESAKNVRELVDAEAKLNEVYEAKKTVQRANIDNENEIVKRRRELSELSKTHQRDIEAENRLINDKNGSISANAKALAEMQAQNKTLTTTLKTLAKQYETNQISLEQYSSKSGVLIQEQTKLKVAMGEAQIAMKAQIKEQNAAEGSIDALTHRLGQLRDAQRKMTPEFRENSEAGKFLQITIKQLEEQVNSLNQRSGNFHGSVGNYVEALDTLNARFESGEMSIREMSRAIKEYQLIAMRAGKDSAIGKEALQQAAQYTDQIGDLQRETQMLASDTRTLDAAMTFAKGLAGIYQVHQGFKAMGMGGEQFEKTMQKLVAIQSIFNGAKQIEAFFNKSNLVLLKNLNIVTKAQSAALVFQTKVQNALTAAKVRGAVAANALKIAMLGIVALGIGAVIFGIVKAFQYFTKNTSKASEETKKLAEQQKKLKEETDAENKSIAEQSAKFVGLITQLKTTNANSKERNDLMKKINTEYGTTLTNLSDEAKFQEQANYAVAQYIALQRTKFRMQKKEERFTQLLEKELALENKINKAIKDGTQFRGMVLVDLEAKRQELRDLGVSEAEISKRFTDTDVRTDFEKWNDELDDTRKRLKWVAGDTALLQSEIDALMGTTFKGAKTTERSTKATKENTTSTKENTTATEQHIDTKKELNDLLFEISETEDEYFNRFKTSQADQEDAVREKYFNLIQAAKYYNEEQKKQIIDTATLEAAQEYELGKIRKAAAQKTEVEKLEALNKQRELDNIKKAKTQDEFNELEKQRKIDHLEGLLSIEQKYGEKTIDTEIAIASARQDLKEKDEKNSEQLAKSIEQIYTKSADNAIQALQRQSDAAGNMFNAFSQMAQHGTIEMSQSMAAMIDRQEQIQRQQEKIEQRKLRMQRASSVGTILTKALDSGKSVPEALAEVGAFLAASEALMPSFYEGTENTGKGGNLDANGGFIAKLHKGERVITENQNRLIGDVSNPVVADVVYKWRTGQLENNGGNSAQLMHTLTNEMREIKKAIQNQPQQVVGLEETLSGVVKLATSTRKGSHTKTSRYHD